MKQWEVVIGIETHAQLLTQSKIFSGSSTAFGAEPNAQANAVDLALPGVLPVLNRVAVECAIRFGLAVDDYGTGRSNLQLLARIPFSELKIDRVFVAGIHSDPQAASITPAPKRPGRASCSS